MIRGIIISVLEGVIKRFSAAGRPGESFAGREYLQHYGFTSRPRPGAEAVILRDGNHIVMIASDDRRYRLAVQEGEVALYTDEGDKVHLRRNRIIEIVGGEKIIATTKVAEITAVTSATLTTPQATVVASTRCQVTSPEINLGGDRASLRTLIDERLLALFNSHTHSGVQAGSGTTGGPNTTLTQATTCTSITKAG